MREKIDDSLERIDSPARASGEIEDQRFSVYAAYGAAECGKWRFLRAFGSHALGHAFEQAIADSLGCLRGYVALGNARAAGRDNQAGNCRQAQQALLNCGLIVGNDFCRDYGEFSFFKGFDNGGSGNVSTLAPGTGIADGENRRG